MRRLLLAVVPVLAALVGCGDNLAGRPANPGDDDGGGDDTPVTAAPTAEIVSPAPGDVLDAQTVQVKVRIIAEAGLSNARLTAGDVSAEITPSALDANGEATVELTLPEGAASLALDALDTQLRLAHAGAEIRVDSEAPALEVAAPRAEAAETRRLLFARLADPSGITAVSYTVNGGAAIDVAVTGAPTELTVREALPLVAGANTVALHVTDGRGHEREQTIAFRYGLETTAGGAHSGALVDGTLYTWGRYNQGQLGLGGTTSDAESRLSPEAVAAFGAEGTQLAAIAFNQNQSLAIRSDGTLWTWGVNDKGQLGLGDVAQRSLPAQVTGLDHVVFAHFGYSHGLALRDDGKVFAWGLNDAGQIGPGGAAGTQRTPVEVTGIPSPVVELVGGSAHSLALTVDGHVYAWGRNLYGNLGGGTVDDTAHPTPTLVPGLDDVIDLANGRDHVLALRADGSVVAWGLGSSGQLGYGEVVEDAEDRSSPVPVVIDAAGTPLTGVRAVFANGNTSYAIVEVAGKPQYWGWGQNFSGQLALGMVTSNGTTSPMRTDLSRPQRIAVFTASDTPEYLDTKISIASIGNGATHTIVRTTTGEIFSWGWNFRGSLGVPTITNAWPQTVVVEVTLPTAP